ncbi:sn-glycerol-3-phosphate ABC transporter ATP-binding protein UgpC [Iodobacter sp. HSC-16F04]|uniref:Sn-glycerol-3-phosphate ABC transporter ATP-binding protein UgpC n=1 Tax=Iodobacter violaceini TaxID=3044271 RepID=A0ABX0KVD5_9NEIS|nr:sn-glycerol-3-phosphate ABC transporter ATP-binding protein UgpC [Iodobacter violacea]NHQ86074.1 sn-glycerol-3-phosphate ABC transporter ATP-binding protein UgpC [Iodobacter violacea]
MATVKLNHLSKSYDNKTQILTDINLDIKHGEFVVLVGPSGCGKSTLLRMLSGLESISGGEMLIDEKVVNDLPPAERGIAMVFQSYALYPHMNVYKNMAFGLRVAGENKAAIEKRILHAAGILKIDHLLDRLPRELSGGQRQRVAIGRAIVREPKLFLFDEPLSNLDASLRVQTRLEIAKLHRSLNATIVYVTHDQVEAMTLGDKIVVMNNCKIQQAGTPLELYQQPANLFVATFIGSPKMNLIEGAVLNASATAVNIKLSTGDTIQAEVDGSTVKTGDLVKVGIRAEHLAEDQRFNERFSGTVSIVEHLGEANYVYLTLNNGQDIVVRGDGDREVHIGTQLEVSAPAAAFHVFNQDGLALRRLKPGNMSTSKTR